MRGEVLEAGPHGGLIAGDDGARYGFVVEGWRGAVPPKAGQAVDFIGEAGTARDIYPLQQETAAPATARPSGVWAATGSSASPATPQPTPTIRPIAAIPPAEGSSVLLGVIGIGCLVLSFVFPVLPLVAAFILGLIGSDSARRHNNSTGLALSRVAWIGAVVLLALGVLVVIALAIFAWPLLELLWQYITYVAQHPQTVT